MKLVRRKHLVDQADAERFLRGKYSRRKQDLERVRMSDDSGQQPGETVFGDQAAPREGRPELRLFGGESQIAEHRDDESETHSRSVDRADNRLWDGREIGVLPLKVGSPALAVSRFVGATAPALARGRRSRPGEGSYRPRRRIHARRRSRR